MNPNTNPPGLFGMFPDKVFPEEVENIKEFMKDTYTTNINGFVDENGFNLNLQREFDNDSMNNLRVGRFSPMDNDDQFREDRAQNESNNENLNNIGNSQNHTPAPENKIQNSNENPVNQNNPNSPDNSDCDQPKTSGAPPTTQMQNNHRNLKKLR
jgi:hypothetical protein